MARLKNEDRLCGAFYKAHSFLNFDLKQHNQNTGPLSEAKMLGINLPGVMRYREQATPDVDKYLGIYSGFCKKEYDLWMNALKFQFKASLLHEILPPKKILNDFFGDLHIRIPHEKTLLISEREDVTTLMSVEEIKSDEYIKHIKKLTGQEKWLVTNPALRSIIKQIKSWEAESVVTCRLTFVHHIDKEYIYKPKRFKRKTLEAITKPTTAHYPMNLVFPCGLTIKKTESFLPVLCDDFLPFVNEEDYALIAPVAFPYSTKPIEGHYLYWDHTEEETLKDKLWKQMSKQWEIDKKEYVPPRNTLWRAAFQTLVHISVLTHPDFKEFCVNMLKKDGMQPNKTPYNKDNPYKSRPGWRPAFEHYVVTINVPDDVNKEADASTHKKRHHLVRGHLMRSHSENSTDGFVWRRSHWRGNKEIGTVTKDYVMDIDERINKQKRKQVNG